MFPCRRGSGLASRQPPEQTGCHWWSPTPARTAFRWKRREEKTRQEQGRYLHPELFGAGPEQAVGYHASPVSTQRRTQAETAHVSSLKMPPPAR